MNAEMTWVRYLKCWLGWHWWLTWIGREPLQVCGWCQKIKKGVTGGQPIFFLLLLSLCLIGWTRPDSNNPVLLIEQDTSDCQRYEWDTRPCTTFFVQNGFEGWQKQMTIEEVNTLVDNASLEYCHPGLKTEMKAGFWLGIVISPVDPFGGQAPHFQPRAWEVQCG